MFDKKYTILIDNEIIADNMELNNALILVKALFDHYYEEHSMVISIKEIKRMEGEND